MAKGFFEEFVEQDARIVKAARMLPSSGPLTAEQRRQTFQRIGDFLKKHGLTQSDLAKSIREPQSVVSGLFNNSSRITDEKRDDVLRRANAWLDLEDRAIEGQRRRPLNYHETRVAKTMMGMARKLTERPDIGVCWGPAGVGKSTIAKAIAAELPNVVLVAARTGRLRLCGFMKAVYDAMRTRRRKRHRVYFDDLVEAFQQSSRVSSRPLLLIDQCHLIKHEPVYQLLMDLQEEAGISILMIGTVDLHKTVTADENPAFYGQLSSRVGLRCDLTPELSQTGSPGVRKTFTVADVRAIFQSSRVKLHSDTAKMLADIANDSDGHLRRVERLMEWATRAARKRSKAESVTVLVGDVYQAARFVKDDDSVRVVRAADPEQQAAAG